MAKGRLASNCYDAWANAGFIASSHTERTLDCCAIIESTLLLESRFLYTTVANLYVFKNTQGNKSFIWHKQLTSDYDIPQFYRHGWTLK